MTADHLDLVVTCAGCGALLGVAPEVAERHGDRPWHCVRCLRASQPQRRQSPAQVAAQRARRQPRTTVHCAQCGAAIEMTPSQARTQPRRYCTLRCACKGRWAKPRLAEDRQ